MWVRISLKAHTILMKLKMSGRYGHDSFWYFSLFRLFVLSDIQVSVWLMSHVGCCCWLMGLERFVFVQKIKEAFKKKSGNNLSSLKQWKILQHTASIGPKWWHLHHNTLHWHKIKMSLNQKKVWRLKMYFFYNGEENTVISRNVILNCWYALWS